MTEVCHHFGIEPPLEPIHELLFMERSKAVLAWTTALACILGPIAEETLFRGILFSSLRRYVPRAVAIAISAALFAAAHTNVVGFLPIFLLGCLLAELYERTGSLFSPIAVHIVHNTLLIGGGIITRELLFT